MKINEIKELVDLIEKSKIDILKLEKGDFKLYYQKQDAKSLQLNDGEGTWELSSEETEEPISSIPKKEKNEEKDPAENDHQITAPIIGAFYSRANPEAKPFVQIGTKIKKGDTVCILEAMKLLNEISSDVNGEIVEVLVEDGQIIEYGQPLFTVRVSE
ncbi:acetyl-CoA carboxylase biotin carboxyl carrier protein [Pseudogracilibacillus auburnensis]|uniref:Biotin carboxyl carrier protein of acetyl-CoA carboxylase n=1 Tax=Pseudogracilibacillus auburnensis TaxID=1494959 RepID=A0A2V3VSW3_9BACI|nr:acetyl-CoA carboxylase biotin carboxyl carrier protein [Pseudogracilibacillus auburnensis]PXW83798.1 acetyl-CoA carboxylase biotin carboxyl carrier protein [Pseudogracilibacillus auburnensis]